MRRLVALLTVLVGTTTVGTTLLAGPAAANPNGPPPVTPRSGASTELTFTSTGPGQAVQGYIANLSSSFDPLAGYPPAANPPGPDFSVLNESFAGVLRGTTPGGTANAISLYCIDIRTSTYVGVGYVQGTWSESNVPRVGYVAQILNSYYPAVPGAPAGAANANQRAAAVQAAIWFFADRYVLNANDPLRPLVEGIVADVLSRGPLVQPPPPALSIAPPTLTGERGTVLGPYTISSGAPTATVTAPAAELFADAAATVPIVQGASVAAGSSVYVRSNTVQTVTVVARAQVTVPTGNVYLYDQNTPGLTTAQRLILAATAEVSSTASATATFTEVVPTTTTTTTTTTTSTTVPSTTTTTTPGSTTTDPGTTTTTVEVSPTSIANTTTDPGSLPSTGGGPPTFVAVVVLAVGAFLLYAARRSPAD